jgi:hypothetical protein
MALQKLPPRPDESPEFRQAEAPKLPPKPRAVFPGSRDKFWHARAVISKDGELIGDTGWSEFTGLGSVWPALETVAGQYDATLHPSARKRWAQFRTGGIGNARLRLAETAGVTLAAQTSAGEVLSISVRVRI